MSSATDELRRMLDERGVEYREHRYSGQSVTTIWRAGCEFHYRENRHGETRLHADGLTPEQAVEATLGKGECDNIHEPPKDATFWPSPHFKCSECGATHISMDYVFYCPNCGRKVRA